jgi:IS1 family transposase
MNLLTKEKRIQVLSALIEGNSIRSTVRMTGVAKNTIVKLLKDVGQACEQYQNEIMVDLPCKRLQVDEIWSFCYAKQKNVPQHLQGILGFGDVWTWVAIDADTKLVPVWLVGGRNSEWAYMFMRDLAGRLKNRVQLTSDGYTAYISAVTSAFANDIDYATIIKLYGKAKDTPEQRYSPSKLTGIQLAVVRGNPDTRHISTSFVERQNLTMRMSMRRFTRLTNGFSKKIDNLNYAVALHFMNYNFCRIHKTLNTTPAMAAGVSDHLWTIEDIINLLGEK